MRAACPCCNAARVSAAHRSVQAKAWQFAGARRRLPARRPAHAPGPKKPHRDFLRRGRATVGAPSTGAIVAPRPAAQEEAGPSPDRPDDRSRSAAVGRIRRPAAARHRHVETRSHGRVADTPAPAAAGATRPPSRSLRGRTCCADRSTTMTKRGAPGAPSAIAVSQKGISSSRSREKPPPPPLPPRSRSLPRSSIGPDEPKSEPPPRPEDCPPE